MFTLRWLRLAALCALCFSAASAVDELLDVPAFCGAGGGCDAVRNAQFGRWLGRYLPFLGLFGYSSVFWGTLVPVLSLRRAALWMAVVGCLVALALLVAQWMTAGTFCALCLVVDISALSAAVLAVLALRRTPSRVTSWPFAAWAALFLLAVGSPPVYGLSKPTPIPSYVRAEMTDDVVDIVEVSDFECPYCRALHAELGDLLDEYGKRVRLVRLPYPLPGHRHALGATRAYLCAADQDAGEAMAHRLFTASDLSWSQLPAMAEGLSLDRVSFEACLESLDSLGRVQRLSKKLSDAGIAGVPVVWVEGRHLPGFDEHAGADRYRDAIEAALAGRPVTPRPLPYVVLLAVVAVVVTVGVRAAGRQTQD